MLEKENSETKGNSRDVIEYKTKSENPTISHS